jgi:hypothetical protein
MDVLLTPDVINHLGIASTSIHSTNTIQPSVVFAFSKTHISFISNEKPSQFVDPTFVKIRTRLNSFSLPVTFESIMQTTTRHWIFTFSYSPDTIASPLHEPWMTLLDISHVQQLRSDVRVSASKKNIDALRIIPTATEIFFHDTKADCTIQNISFSGARLLCIENDLIEGDDKIVLKIQFSSPCEIASLRAVILRKQIIDIVGISCIDIAVRFFEPVDLILRTRLADFFKKYTEGN